MGGARSDGDTGEREGVHGEGAGQGGGGWVQCGGGAEGDRDHEPEGDECRVEQVNGPAPLQRHCLDGCPH